jgi:hypothetical protein
MIIEEMGSEIKEAKEVGVIHVSILCIRTYIYYLHYMIGVRRSNKKAETMTETSGREQEEISG